MYVILKNPRERKLVQREVMDKTKQELKTLLPGNEIFTQDLSLTGFSASRGFPVEFSIEGPDWQKLRDYSKIVIEKLKATGLLEDINTDFEGGMPEIHIVPNREKAALHGVSVTTLGQEVSYMVGGQIFSANTQYPKDGHRYYIRVRSEEDQHLDLKDIERLQISNDRGTGGELIHLPDVADIQVTTAPQLINRINRARAIPMYANVTQGKSQQDALDAVTQIAKEVFPPHSGYGIQPTGSAQAFHDAFSGLIFALILGIAVAYMVLASQFNSFIHPVTVLTALPFSLSGALSALYFTNQSLSLFQHDRPHSAHGYR